MENTTVCFTITGEFLTRHARDLMLEDEPGKAYRLIADGLGGCSGAIAAAIDVAKGSSKLIGDSNTGVDLVPDESPAADEYRKAVAWLYAGRVRHKGSWVRPAGVITAWGLQDATAAGYQQAHPNKGAFRRARAAYYAPEGGVAELALVPVAADQPPRERWVVFEPTTEPPQWLAPATSLDGAVVGVLEGGRTLREYGPDPSTYERPAYLAAKIIRGGVLDEDEADALREAAYAAEDAEHAAQCLVIGERVREQAGENVFPMTLKDGRVVRVPKAPFAHWALERLPDDVPRELPEWELVAPSGIKMPNDNRYHTDWVLGAGLDPADCYGAEDENINGPAWVELFRLQTAAIDAHEASDA